VHGFTSSEAQDYKVKRDINKGFKVGSMAERVKRRLCSDRVITIA